MILITAPTSQIGTRVVDRLLESGADLRLVTRDPSRLTDAVRERTDVIAGSHGDPEVMGRAAEGVDAVFWLSPNDASAPDLAATFVDFARPAARAFAESGVGRIVGISAIGRGTAWEKNSGCVTASLEMDDLFAESGIPYRAVVNPSFMDNVLNGVETIREENYFSLPVPADLRAPTVATSDIADVTSRLLLDTGWTGFEEVGCLGPEDLTPEEMAATISEVIGREVEYRPTTPEAFRQRMVGFGMTEALAQGYSDMFQAKAEGMDSTLPRTAANTTPTTFRQFTEQLLAPAVGT